MVHRSDPAGLVVVSQLAHAWLSGQLARVWGNDAFGRLEPREELCLAAELHDIGWLEWEQSPALNPATGRPYTFMEMPRKPHLAIWSAGAPYASVWGRYVALLVSLHGTALYERRNGAHDSPEDAQLIQEFFHRSRAFQCETAKSLEQDPQYAPHVTPAALQRNQRLIGVWDHLSLLLAMGVREESRIERVPCASGYGTLTVAAKNTDATAFTVAPWPFGIASVTVVGEGRRLPDKFSDENQMRAALARAPSVTLAITLSPA